MHSICLSLAAVYTVREWTASGEHLTFPYRSSYFAYGSIGQRLSHGRPPLVLTSAPIFPDVVNSRAQLVRETFAPASTHHVKIRRRIRRGGSRPLIATTLHYVCTMLQLAANTNSNRRRSGETPPRRPDRHGVPVACRWARRRYYAPAGAILTRARLSGRTGPTTEIRIAGPRRSPARFAPETASYTTEFHGLPRLTALPPSVMPTGRPAPRRGAPLPSTPTGSAGRAARSRVQRHC